MTEHPKPDPDCPVCKGTGTVRNVGDYFTTTVEAAAAYEQAHGIAPEYRTFKCVLREVPPDPLPANVQRVVDDVMEGLK